MAAPDVKQSAEKIPPLNPDRVHYSERYTDDNYEYRHVILPKEFGKFVPRTHLLTETEWRNLGIQQSPGWEHYMIHLPEPHVLIFRRPLPPGTFLSQPLASRSTSAQIQVLDDSMDIIMDSFGANDSAKSDGEADENCPLTFHVNES